MTTLAFGSTGLAVGATADDFGRFTDVMHVTEIQDPADPEITARYTRAFQKCQDAAETTSQNESCFADEWKRQDAVLNRTWKTTFARITGPDHAQLLAAQRAWVAARDPFCTHFAEGFSGGSIMGLESFACAVELTIRRIVWLEKLR